MIQLDEGKMTVLGVISVAFGLCVTIYCFLSHLEGKQQALIACEIAKAEKIAEKMSQNPTKTEVVKKTGGKKELSEMNITPLSQAMVRMRHTPLVQRDIVEKLRDVDTFFQTRELANSARRLVHRDAENERAEYKMMMDKIYDIPRVAQRPVIQQPFVQQSFAQQPFNQQQFNQQPFVRQPFVRQSFIRQPAMQQPVMEQPTMQQPPVMQQGGQSAPRSPATAVNNPIPNDAGRAPASVAHPEYARSRRSRDGERTRQTVQRWLDGVEPPGEDLVDDSVNDTLEPIRWEVSAIGPQVDGTITIRSGMTHISI